MDMVVQPSKFPGSHERHLLRKAGNPLFVEQRPELTDEALLEAQRLDHELLLKFTEELRKLLFETTGLAENEDSEKVLAIKERLDLAYEAASALTDNQQETKQSIAGLLKLVTAAIRRGAGGDVHAQQELDQEEAAREDHFRLLESQLVADLLNPKSVIKAPELVATLLSCDKEDVLLALQLFDAEQVAILLQQGGQLLSSLADVSDVSEARFREKLYLIQEYSDYLGRAGVASN